MCFLFPWLFVKCWSSGKCSFCPFSPNMFLGVETLRQFLNKTFSRGNIALFTCWLNHKFLFKCDRSVLKKKKVTLQWTKEGNWWWANENLLHLMTKKETNGIFVSSLTFLFFMWFWFSVFCFILIMEEADEQRFKVL